MSTWIEDEVGSRTRAKDALKKAKRIEANAIERGYRYVRVSSMLSILVECDAEGNPTQKGLERINLRRRENDHVKIT